MRTLPATLAMLALVVLAAAPAAGGGVTAESAFEQLKALAGTWSGPAAGEGEAAESEAETAPEVVHVVEVSAAGTVVMETMRPDTPHEMINMYHLDGDDLVLTHYCAGGNQPRMRLDREASSAERLVFDYAGGTNHDPAVDAHIHAADIRWIDADHIESAWTGYSGGEKAGRMTFRLARSE